MTRSAPTPPMLRLFIAVPLPDAWLTALEELQRELRNARLRLRYVRPEAMHLTLRFLGDSPASRVPDLSAALDAAAVASLRFTLRLGHAGHFGSAARPRVLWVGVEGETDLLAGLQRGVEIAVRSCGAPPEEQRFRAHLTLARVPEGMDRAELGRIVPVLGQIAAPSAPEYRPEHLHLIRSDLSRSGPAYTLLHRASIGGATA